MERERLFDYPFDFEAYIETRLRGFEDIEERKFAKAVLQKGLLRIVKEADKRYAALEQRVRAEVENQDDKYVIATTIVRRGDYDPINPTWFPLVEEELAGIQLSAEAVASLGEAGALAGRVYLEADDALCREIDETRPALAGKLLTDRGEIPAQFELRKSARHQERIAELYRLFSENGVPWTTFPAAYADKCYEIRLRQLDRPLEKNETPQGIEVQYAQYAAYARPEWIVLWNVEPIRYDCAQFPIPCIDRVHYEHEFPLEEFGRENGFLIESQGEIAGLRYEKEKLFIITQCQTFSGWRARKVVARPPEKSLGYDWPILRNAKQRSFTASLLQQSGRVLKTRADLRRQIIALGYESTLHYTGCSIRTEPDAEMLDGDMNWFIGDELFDKNAGRVLLLEFEAADPQNYLNSALVRYIVSEVQQYQAEYRCMGKWT